MTTLSPGLDAALAGSAALIFIAAEIAHPAGTLRLLDGAGSVAIDGETFTGADATYGVLNSIETFTDGIEAEAPRLVLSILPPTNTAAASLADPLAQGSSVTLWFGALDPATGLVIDEPELWFLGELDTPTLRIGEGSRVVEFEVASIWERFFRTDEGARLNAAFHESVWPGELGLQFATEVQRQLPWGSDLPRPVAITDAPIVAGGPGANIFDVRSLFR